MASSQLQLCVVELAVRSRLEVAPASTASPSRGVSTACEIFTATWWTCVARGSECNQKCVEWVELRVPAHRLTALVALAPISAQPAVRATTTANAALAMVRFTVCCWVWQSRRPTVSLRVHLCPVFDRGG